MNLYEDAAERGEALAKHAAIHGRWPALVATWVARNAALRVDAGRVAHFVGPASAAQAFSDVCAARGITEV